MPTAFWPIIASQRHIQIFARFRPLSSTVFHLLIHPIVVRGLLIVPLELYRRSSIGLFGISRSRGTLHVICNTCLVPVMQCSASSKYGKT
jgi:hypothetical protein